MLNRLLIIGVLWCFGGKAAFPQPPAFPKNKRVLVYVRNGPGYVHENIPFAVACLQQLGREHGFAVDATAEPGVMTEASLKQYNVVVFASTNNDAFDTDAQRLAFRRYIEAGGGFVGVHSAVGTERRWQWFKELLGGTFAWHPRFQRYTIRRIDAGHPSVAAMPQVWQKEDECYFLKELSPGPTVLMAHDLTTLDTTEAARIRSFGLGYTRLYPAVWLHDYDGGTTWCTALGHDKKDYTDPIFIRHLLGGLRYVALKASPRPDFRRAYALRFDEPLRRP